MTDYTATTKALDLPFEEAIDYLRQKANVTSTGWTDVWQKANAKSFTVAGATTETLVEDFRREVARALESGTTLAEFRKGFDAIVEKHGWTHTGRPGWRSRVIYETNLSMAYSAGRYAQQTEPETLAAFPNWQYVHSGAKHPRKQHLAWNGMVLSASDPFWDWAYPPNGWGCGCRVRPVSDAGLKRQGRSGLDQAPARIPTTTVNRRTGEVLKGSAGVDPGFDYNPGQVWKNAPGASVPGLSPAQVAAAPAKPAEVRRFAERVLSGEAADPAATIVAARLPDDLAAVLGGGRADIELSAFRVAKVAGQAVRLGGRASTAHPEITARDWSRLQAIVDRAEAFLDDKVSAKGHRQMVFHDIDEAGRRLELILRRVPRPGGGERVIVPTFRQTGERGHAKAVRRLRRIRG